MLWIRWLLFLVKKASVVILPFVDVMDVEVLKIRPTTSALKALLVTSALDVIGFRGRL